MAKHINLLKKYQMNKKWKFNGSMHKDHSKPTKRQTEIAEGHQKMEALRTKWRRENGIEDII